MISVNSFAVATFLIGAGHAPLDCELLDGFGKAVFYWPDSVRPDLERYRTSKAKLDQLVASKRTTAAEPAK